ncbi:unnamed protein product, partial [Rotaria sp. Silwood1]
MSNEIETDLTKTESLNDEKEELKDNIEQRTVPSIADVQSFCAEFHIKVDNAVGIRPWLQFSDTNFSEKILKQFEEDEFDMPTPIQSIAWPILSQNRDLVGIANSGSGKTLAFILPLIFHIRQQINDNSIAIILTSTRESVQYIYSTAQSYFNLFDIKSICIINGDEHEKQINEICDGKIVYICLLNRLNDLLEQQLINIHHVTFIVLDDIDKMIDLGLETQIRKFLDNFKTI